MNSDASAKEKGANYSTIIWFIDFLVVVSSSLIDPAFGIVVNILNSFFLIFHVRFVCVLSYGRNAPGTNWTPKAMQLNAPSTVQMMSIYNGKTFRVFLTFGLNRNVLF